MNIKSLLSKLSLLSTWLAAQNVGIGTSSPHSSARLHVYEGPGPNYYGLLIPNVPLTSSTDATTILSPAHSLLVYVPSGSGLAPAGYYYNAGTPSSPNWVPLQGAAANAWLLNGNAGTNPNSNFLGTLDNTPLIIRVNNWRAFRIEPTDVDTAPNIIGGYSGNNVSAGVVGATISGGGVLGFPNQVSGLYGTIGGGYNNNANGAHTTIGGGLSNYAYGTATTIGGGQNNYTDGQHSTVGGGLFNQSNTDYAAIAGGAFNIADAQGAFVGGGYANYAMESYTSVLGGTGNVVNTQYSTIGGGEANNIDGMHSGILGGYQNAAPGSYSNIVGGYQNAANSDYDFIGGGQYNTTNSLYATIGGGMQNTASGYAAVIGGGTNNSVTNPYVVISGGRSNQANAGYSTISGGENNSVGVNSSHATIGGGYQNSANAQYTTVAGGSQASATHYGEMAYASGAFQQVGDAQSSLYVLRASTPGSSNYYELFLDGLGQRITIPDGRTMTFQILVTARDISGNSAGYRFEGVIKNVGGTVSLVGGGPLTPVMTKEDVSSWDARVVADDTNDALVIEVKGDSGVRWVAAVRTAEVSHDIGLSP